MRERLVRESDGTLYAWRCLSCGTVWKVYQSKPCDCHVELDDYHDDHTEGDDGLYPGWQG